MANASFVGANRVDGEPRLERVLFNPVDSRILPASLNFAFAYTKDLLYGIHSEEQTLEPVRSSSIAAVHVLYGVVGIGCFNFGRPA